MCNSTYERGGMAIGKTIMCVRVCERIPIVKGSRAGSRAGREASKLAIRSNTWH